MDAPLASAAGNAVEVAYALDYLTGARREPRFHAVTVALGAEMLVSAVSPPTAGRRRPVSKTPLTSGRAAERFARMVASLGGPSDLLERPGAHLPAAPVRRRVEADGTVAEVATREIGLAVIALGGGRTRPQDGIDPAVGLPISPARRCERPARHDPRRRRGRRRPAEAALRAGLPPGRRAGTAPAVIERIGG